MCEIFILLVTWSINWDAVSSCGNIYVYASNFERIFGIPNSISNIESDASI